MDANPGFCPDAARGKRVHVILRNGTASKAKSPQGWAADGRSGCNWSLDAGPFTILKWEIA